MIKSGENVISHNGLGDGIVYYSDKRKTKVLKLKESARDKCWANYDQLIGVS